MPTRPRKPQRQYQHVVAPNGEGSPSPCHASTLARTVVLLILVCACTPTSSSTSPGGTANTPSATSRRPLSPGKGSNTYADSTNTDQHQSHGSSDATNVLSPACPGGAISGKTVTKTGKIDYSFRHIGPAGVPALLDYLSEQNTPQAGAEADAGHFSPKTALIGVAEVEGSIATDSTVEDTARDRQCSPSVSMTATSVSSPLHELGLRECLLGDTGVAEAAQSSWICGPDGVKVLSLRQNQLTAAGVRALFSSLESASEDRLLSLQLDFNPLGNSGVQPLVAYLKQRGSRGGGGLEELSLRFCNIGPAGCRYLSSALLKSAASASPYESAAAEPPATTSDDSRPERVATPTSIGERSKTGGGKPAEDAEERPPAAGIRSLLLTGNNLGGAGARALASALAKDRSLEVLDLTRCHIGDDGARYLSDALRANTSLRELRLGYNGISADGAAALATLLKAGPGTLEILELGGNRIGDGGAVALAEGLAADNDSRRGRRSVRGVKRRRQQQQQQQQQGNRRERGGLLRLGLSGNGIGCVGGCALAKALRSGSGGSGVVLEELELAGNVLTLSGAQASDAKKKGASLYKSAGGALSSLLNQFVDESYYRSDQSSSSSNHGTTSGGGKVDNGAPLRCGVAALAESLLGGGSRRSDRDSGRKGQSRLRVLGLARTGMTERDASRLAKVLRRRQKGDDALEEVEVGMNGLDPKTVEAVQSAVKGTTVEDPDSDEDDDDDENDDTDTDHYEDDLYQSRDAPTINDSRGPARSSTGAGGIMRRSASKSRSTEAETWEKPRLQRPPATTPKRRVLPKESRNTWTEKTGGRWEDDGYESEAEDMRVRGSTPPPVARRVELEMFGRKVASFGKRDTDGPGGIDVQVFGKRVSVSQPPSSSRRRIAGPSVATADHDMKSHHDGDGIDLETDSWSSSDSGDSSDDHDIYSGDGDESAGDIRDNQYSNDDEEDDKDDEEDEDDDDDGDTSGDDQETEEENDLEDHSFSGPSGSYGVDEEEQTSCNEEEGTETFTEGDDEENDYPRHHRGDSAVSFDSMRIAPSTAATRRRR